MKICIYGVGVIGGILAGALARTDHQVCAIGRGPHLDAIRRNGLTVRKPGGESYTARFPASAEPREFGVQDLVIIATKQPALTDVARAIAPLLGPHTLVGCAVNGVFWFYGDGFAPGGRRLDVSRLDPAGELRRVIGPERSLGLVAWHGGEIVEPGVLETSRDVSKFTIGAAMAQTEAGARKAAGDLAHAHDLVIEAADDIRRAMWTKYASALSIQAVSVLTGGTNSQCVNDPAIFDLIVAIAREAYAVAASQGYGDLVFDIADMRARRVNSHHKPSMLQDIERGRVVELDAQYLVLQDIARQCGIATPLIDTITPLTVARARVAGCYPPV